ncbi:MAG: DUF1820 family protein [Pseudomonadota bacterium]
MSTQSVYKVIFYNQGEIYEIYARDIYQSEIYGFIEVEEFIFGDADKVILNPGEERLKQEFSGVKRSFVPIQAIIRIDEVERGGEGKVKEIKSSDKVAKFPSDSFITTPKPGKDS